MMSCGEFYTIRPGDTLTSIAAIYGTDAEKILRLNPGLEAENLIPGTQICVFSETVQPVQCPPGSIAYNIKAGDTLRTIAESFGTTVDALIESNPDIEPFNLNIGQRICIDQPRPQLPECDSGNYYIIRRGDTVRAIAEAFEVSAEEILRLNPGLNPRNLIIGEIICIPTAPSPIEIVINITARRLTVYRNGSIYREYIVAVGKPETPTPTGTFTIINKEIDPGGPYGTRWLGLSIRGYGIHGTNAPESIGTAASNGCIRMYNEDVEALFDITPVGTVVRILP